MASFFGSVAQEVGGAMKENAANQREERLSDRDYARKLQLEKMRMTHDGTLLDRRMAADDRRTRRTNEAQALRQDVMIGAQEDQAKSLQEFQGSERQAKERYESVESRRDRESRERIAAMGMYKTERGAGTIRSKGWTIDTEMRQVQNPETFAWEEKPFYIAHKEGSPGAWTQDGDLMFRGDDRTAYQEALQKYPGLADRNKRYALEDRLMQYSGDKDVEKQFIQKYGYLPVRYMESLTDSAEGWPEYWESVRTPTDSAVNAAQGVTSSPPPITDQTPEQSQGMTYNDEVRTFAHEYARYHGLPTELVDAVIMQESSGKHNQTSKKGAIGFMQLMPDTAKDLGVDPYHWQQNIAGGVTYLKQQLDRYEGNVEKALAAYNAGPNRMWLQEEAGWLDKAPKETQDYVTNIMNNANLGNWSMADPYPLQQDDTQYLMPGGTSNELDEQGAAEIASAIAAPTGAQ